MHIQHSVQLHIIPINVIDRLLYSKYQLLKIKLVLGFLSVASHKLCFKGVLLNLFNL